MRLLRKKAVTALVVFIILTGAFSQAARVVLIGTGVTMVINRHRVATTPVPDHYGRAVGLELRRKYWKPMWSYSAALSAVLSVVLVFGGAFPWCRPAALPPHTG